MEDIKKFDMENFLVILQTQFDTFWLEIAELSNTKNNENRLNSFLLNLEIFREKNVEHKQENRKKIKIIDPIGRSKTFLILAKWEPFLKEFSRNKLYK